MCGFHICCVFPVRTDMVPDPNHDGLNQPDESSLFTLVALLVPHNYDESLEAVCIHRLSFYTSNKSNP